MKLEKLEKEVGELFEDIKYRGRKATVKYQGTKTNYEANKKKAIIGGLVGLVALHFIPIVGIGALTYCGIKGYQAYKDKKNDKRDNNTYNRRTAIGGNRTNNERHTIG